MEKFPFLNSNYKEIEKHDQFADAWREDSDYRNKSSRDTTSLGYLVSRNLE